VLVEVQHTSGTDELLIATKDGIAIRFPEGDIRSMGRGAAGVRGIRLDKGDQVVTDQDDLMVMTEQGKAIRLRCHDIKTISRNTQGVRLVKLSEGDKVARVAPIAAEPPVNPELPIDGGKK